MKMSDQPDRIPCILIEDEILALEMMQDYIGRRKDLELIGIGTELSEAMELFEQHKPAIIFLDLVIPPGESAGYHFGKLPATSSVVVVSGMPLSHFDGVLPEGDLYELSKPFSFESFDKCVDRVLKKRKIQYEV